MHSSLWDGCFFYEIGRGDNMIELNHIDKIFKNDNNHIHAVKDVSLKVDKGDIFGVIGFSGAGKSTLIRCINLLERATHGEVKVDGKNLLELNAKELRQMRKKIGMIFQHFNLMKSRNVYDNIAFSLKGSGLSKGEINQKIIELLNLVELSDKAKAYPSQLSGGQKQRVAIARALANDPHILLCDEATSALDPQTTQSILTLLKSLNERFDLTIVLITHEMAVVKAICNKVAIMDHGNIVESGNILDVFSSPKQQISKDFINTASAIHDIYAMIENHDPLVSLAKDEKLLHLTYSANSAEKPLLANIVKDYDVSFNIIFGNIEILNGSPLGNLVVKLKGDMDKIKEVIDTMIKQDVKVEVLK